MKIRKIMSNKAVVLAIAAAAALASGSAGAASSADSLAHDIGAAVKANTVQLNITNHFPGTCVRVYGFPRWIQLGYLQSAGLPAWLNQKYTASVFRGNCGGTAIRTDTYTTHRGDNYWEVKKGK